MTIEDPMVGVRSSTGVILPLLFALVSKLAIQGRGGLGWNPVDHLLHRA